MNPKNHTLFLFIFLIFLVCNVQQAQTTLPKVQNHLNGELDYTHEALELVQTQANGEEISLGKVDTDGSIHFNLPEFDIKALHDNINLQHPGLQKMFKINSDCKDRDVFVKTPYDDEYSQKYDPIYVKKFGIYVAALYPVSDEKIVSRNQNNRTILPAEATYFWFYIDRAITYKEECTSVSSSTGNIYAEINVNIKFEKGWNLIEENLVDVQNVVQGESQTTIRTIEFKRSSPASKKVKWILKQIQDDEKIQLAKKLHNLTPITKTQFEKWVPNKLDDLSITTNEHGNPPKGLKNKNNIHLIYANETLKKVIDLYVVDCAKSPDDMEMINFAYAMENRRKDEKDIKPYVAQYNEREKITQLLYKVEERLLVTASSASMNDEELWEYIQKLNVAKLLKNQ